MSGPYTRGKQIHDIAWNRFIDDLKQDELNTAAGIAASRFFDMQISENELWPADPERMEELRKYLSQKMKGYRQSSGSERDSITSLLKAHGIYCKNIGKPKWKRVHNVMAYRYADANALTMRMIARKIGKCKEETDNDLLEGQRNLVKLCCGFPAVSTSADDRYRIVEDLLNNYMILDASKFVMTAELFQDEWKNEISEMREATKKVMKSFDTAFRVYEIFCEGYGGIEKRRIEVLRARYTESKVSAPDMARLLHVGLSTVQNDCRISIKRLSDIMFCEMNS